MADGFPQGIPCLGSYSSNGPVTLHSNSSNGPVTLHSNSSNGPVTLHSNSSNGPVTLQGTTCKDELLPHLTRCMKYLTFTTKTSKLIPCENK